MYVKTSVQTMYPICKKKVLSFLFIFHKSEEKSYNISDRLGGTRIYSNVNTLKFWILNNVLYKLIKHVQLFSSSQENK